MKNRFVHPSMFSALVLPFLVACGGADAPPADEPMAEAEESHSEDGAWSYAGDNGPAAWGMLSSEFSVCSEGVEQSPIDVATGSVMSAGLDPLMMSYQATSWSLEDTGHAINAVPAGDHHLMIGDDSYRLLQFHAHTPSEHTIDGQFFPMEVHFVHQSASGQLAVVGVMVQEGATDDGFGGIAAALADGSMSVSDVDPRALLPESLEYFTYPGSLTTPPCSEGVRWNLLKTPVTLTAELIAVFEGTHGVTNRPVQPINQRSVSGDE